MEQTRKEMTQAYKAQTFKIGVYQIRNTKNDKVLIGSSMDLDKIWNRHQFELNMGSHRNKKIQKDWKAYGAESFVFEVLQEVEQKPTNVVPYSKQIKALEATFVDEKQPFGEVGYH